MVEEPVPEDWERGQAAEMAYLIAEPAAMGAIPDPSPDPYVPVVPPPLPRVAVELRLRE